MIIFYTTDRVLPCASLEGSSLRNDGHKKGKCLLSSQGAVGAPFFEKMPPSSLVDAPCFLISARCWRPNLKARSVVFKFSSLTDLLMLLPKLIGS